MMATTANVVIRSKKNDKTGQQDKLIESTNGVLLFLIAKYDPEEEEVDSTKVEEWYIIPEVGMAPLVFQPSDLGKSYETIDMAVSTAIQQLEKFITLITL